MKAHMGIIAIGSILLLAQTSQAAFYGDPPDEHHPWSVHDHNRPQPKVVTPGSFSTAAQPGKPPSDAIVLFDGTDATLKANWVELEKIIKAQGWDKKKK